MDEKSRPQSWHSEDGKAKEICAAAIISRQEREGQIWQKKKSS